MKTGIMLFAFAICTAPLAALTLPSTAYNPVPSGQYRTLRANTIRINPAIYDIKLDHVTAKNNLTIKSAAGTAGVIKFKNLTLYSPQSSITNVRTATIQKIKSTDTTDSNSAEKDVTLIGNTIIAQKINKNPKNQDKDQSKIMITKANGGRIEFPTTMPQKTKALRWTKIYGVFEGEEELTQENQKPIKVLSADMRSDEIACEEEKTDDACCIQDSEECRLVMAPQIAYEAQILRLTNYD